MKVSSHPIPSHRDLVPSRLIPGLIPSHPGPTPGWDGTRTGYPGPGGQPRTRSTSRSMIDRYIGPFQIVQFQNPVHSTLLLQYTGQVVTSSGVKITRVSSTCILTRALLYTSG